MQTTITFDQLEAEFLKDKMEKLLLAAYEKGVQDGINKYSYPPVLTNKLLGEIFQIAQPTVIKMTADPTFPRFSKIQARYPRDQVFKWIEQNSSWVKENTKFYSKEAM
ncbi:MULTISPECIES: hypothetical protein [Niallia]|uniref:hypothetical protein n=1 Tax=Niallia TaxID=2837506 RepID=UPI002E21AFD6|nr:hypothetical protein [Niallia circulans]